MLAKLLTILAVTLVLSAVPALAQKGQIAIDDMDAWFSEVYSGNDSGGGFLEGPRIGCGSPGQMAFDQYGNAFVAAGCFVYVVTSDDQVHLLAGVPGIPGAADGPADRACLGGINGIAVAPDGAVYLSDVGNFTVRKLARDKAGVWTVSTIAGQAEKKGHTDGPVGQSLLQRPEGIAIDSKGNVYTMDQDWLVRISPDGVAATLNPKGGTGKGCAERSGPLASARFLRIMGSGAIACDEQDNLYLGDKWNMVWWRVDLAAGTITNIAGGPVRGTPGFGRDPVRDGKADEARFHHGGGPSGVRYDRVTGRCYTVTADEHAVRAITPDGWVKTLGPWLTKKGPLGVGPLKETTYRGTARFCGVDPQGRVYVADGGVTYRFYHKPAYAKAAKLVTPNPLLPWKGHAAAAAGVVGRRPMAAAPADAKALAAGDATDLGPAEFAWSAQEATARNGEQELRVYPKRVVAEGAAPVYAIEARLFNVKAAPGSEVVEVSLAGEPVEIARSGCGPVVAFDGQQFVVAYQHGASIYARRVSADGKLIDVDTSIKIGGQWEHRPAIASNGKEAVITGARRPWPNPWGWNGPAAISIGRLTRDGKTPERFRIGYDPLADGGFAGLLDSAQWKGRKGWPAGIPGGFKITANGYWPHLYSAVCWDGKTWVAAWVRAKMRGMSLVDFDLFASRVDPATMMPTSEPVLVAGGEAEPGTQTNPALAGNGDGTSTLTYDSVRADGTVRRKARVLGGGPLTGPARVEPKRD